MKLSDKFVIRIFFLNLANSGFFLEITKTLSQYPWYHGQLGRNDSANLVLHKTARHILAESGTTETRVPTASNTSGVFLVSSETSILKALHILK